MDHKKTGEELFADAAKRQGLPASIEDPTIADRVALLILAAETHLSRPVAGKTPRADRRQK
jgi:hypothetical protein